MVLNRWFLGCCLVGIIGLIPGISFAATVALTKSAANVACLDSAEQALLNGAVNARCHFKELTPRLTPTPATYGAYFCIQRRGSGTSYTVRQCNASSSGILGSFTGSNAATSSETFYNDWNANTFTTVAQASTAGNFYAFLWTTSDDPCLNTPDIEDAPFRSPSPNGSGNVCHNGCAYEVATGYIGTWPSGRLDFSAASLGRACTPSDDPSSDPEMPDDTPPLDIPGETPDTGPDPSDGESGESSSGGGTCASAPVCTGNAIQCNILYQTWATRCSNRDGGNEGGDPGEGGIADLTEVENTLNQIEQNQRDAWEGEAGPGGDGDFSSLGGSKQFSPSDLDTSGLGFPRSCPYTGSDPQITIGSTSITIPFSTSGVCSIYEWSGYLVVALAVFLGCFILIKE